MQRLFLVRPTSIIELGQFVKFRYVTSSYFGTFKKELFDNSKTKENGPLINPSTLEIEMLVKKHEPLLPRLLPVRREYYSSAPLSSNDLEAISIDNYHKIPDNIGDKIALRTVKLLRFVADTFFQEQYVHRAIVLETVAAVPGMVAGMFRHLKCLRRLHQDSGWIHKLLHEAENERMHLMIWMQVTRPTFLERMIVTLVQGGFFYFYALVYFLSPRIAHRMVGYLEEEAIVSYDGFLKEIDAGKIHNGPAPPIAIKYYNLYQNASLRDVVMAVRTDEAAHRDANHHFSDRILSKNEDLSSPLKFTK